MKTFKNNLSATLYYDMTDTDSVIWLNQLVTSEDAATRLAAWPTCDATHSFNLTLMHASTRVLEIVKCTAVSANEAGYISFTAERGQEGTTAIAHDKTTTIVENRLTADVLTTLVTTLDAVLNNTAVLTYYGTLPAGSSVINLNFSYDTTKKNVAVFVSGVLQNSWTATSSTSITLGDSFAEDVDVYVASAGVPAQSVLTAIYNDTVATAGNLMMFVGSVFASLASSTYTPPGCLACDGAEYTSAQFPNFYYQKLVSGSLMTCTYTAWDAQVALTGNCAKFALDTVSQKFKVPLLKDGDSITYAASAAELGKSYKAGLPNITGTFNNYFGGGFVAGTGAITVVDIGGNV